MNTAQATFNSEAHTTFNRELVISFIFYYVVKLVLPNSSYACDSLPSTKSKRNDYTQINSIESHNK